VRPEVPDRQLGHRRVTVHPPRCSEPIPDQHVGSLPVPVGPEADGGPSCRQPQEVGEDLALGGETPSPQALADLAPGQRPLAVQHSFDGPDARCGLLGADAHLPKPPVRRPRVGRHGEVRQPADVLRGDQVQGASHGPQERDRSVVQPGPVDPRRGQALGPDAKGQPGRRQDLGLDPHEVTDQHGRTGALGTVQQLGSRPDPAQPVLREQPPGGQAASSSSNRFSIRWSEASIRSSLSFDSPLPRWISSAERTTNENSWRNFDCQFSNVDWRNSNVKP
jgi:hypothetical protein